MFSCTSIWNILIVQLLCLCPFGTQSTSENLAQADTLLLFPFMNHNIDWRVVKTPWEGICFMHDACHDVCQRSTNRGGSPCFSKFYNVSQIFGLSVYHQWYITRKLVLMGLQSTTLSRAKMRVPFLGK